MTRLDDLRNYIGAKETTSSADEWFESVNPATGELLTRVPQASATDVDKAVASAAHAYTEWSVTPAAERSRILRKAADLLRERIRDLARLEVLDTGKPIAEAKTVDVPSAAECIEYFAGVAPTVHGEHFDLGGSFAYTRREPLGVCAGIGAWNYPLQIAAWKSAPALACGNTMIFKPAELTPVTTLELAKIYTEAGLPPGGFNVVHGDGRVGELLTTHPRIAKISLTGEVATGKRVMAAASRTLKHITLELGGKSPLIIFPDADLDEAVSGALVGNFYTQGQVCSNGTRVFVHRTVHDEVVERLRIRTTAMRIGDPLDPATDVGALISADHLAKVLSYIEAGKAAGAQLVCGGSTPDDAALSGGFFVEPTIFDGCTDDMSIVRDEIFGPVMSILVFDTEEEVLERANDTPYGLSAGIFTRDLQRAHRMAARVEAGTVWINSYNITPVEMPFGGVKESGIGRENSLAAIEHYTQRKAVYMGMGSVASPY